MQEERPDNTRVQLPIPLQDRVPQKEIGPRREQQQPQSQLFDANKSKYYENLQDFYNYNAWGYGISGRQTRHNPRTTKGQERIQSDFNYAKRNVQDFAETLVTTGVAEGLGALFKLATTPVEIGRGAEAIVKSAPASTKVTKVTTIPRSEMHVRNTVHGAAKAKHVSSSNGLHTYTQQKLKILSPEQFQKASKQLENMMAKAGWRKVEHPNLQGIGFTNGRYVISDLADNVGTTPLGRLRFADFAIEEVPQFKAAMQRQGGVLK